MSSEPIAVYGMHRSGTSVVAKALEVLGFDLRLTEDSEVRASPSNAKGHYENKYMMYLSDTILKCLGGAWHMPMMLKRKFVDSPKIKYLLDGALALIEKQFPERIVWKDPRVSLTLPFFERLLGPVKSIICIRNPVEVCQSLAKRDNASIERASALWRSYICSAILNSASKPRLFVHYERLMSDPVSELWRISHFVGGEPYMERWRQCVREFKAFVDEKLHHNHATIRDLYGLPGMDQRAVLLYTLLARPDLEEVVRLITPEMQEAGRGL
jgi:hypothetical protein